jgi:2-succinyl-5-enolpyruvyl-6-hydroxy-3-cyclohexene-1-carboxylate synthase
MTGVNPSTALAQVLVDALVRLGVRHAVLCPGSRSSALAYALAAADRPGADAAAPGGGPGADAAAPGGGPGADAVVPAAPALGGVPSSDCRLQLHVRVDERVAGFLALGLAKETGTPAVVVTTSGTAVANLHPAVLEASHAGVPLLVLSADRPHELRGTGANQTTDQVKLFGDAVRLFAEIPAPDTRAGQARSWRNVVSRAVSAAVGELDSRPGPVHVNVAFREPLTPDEGSGDGSGDGSGKGSGEGPDEGHGKEPGREPGADSSNRARAWPEPLTGTDGLTLVRASGAVTPVWLPDGPRTVVLAGDGAGPIAAQVAAGGGWPLLAEPSSGARLRPLAVGPYRLLLDHPDLGGAIERVLVFGRPTLSRPVSRLLARDDVEVVVVSTRPDWADAAARAALVVPAVRSVRERPDAAGLADAAGRGDPGGSRGGWLDRWLVAGRVAVVTLDTILDAAAEGRLTGPVLARETAAALGPGEALVAGSSNAVRDLDLAAQAFPAPAVVSEARVVLANRGLAGIDGTLSTACGVALARAADGRPVPVRVLVGDLSFLHDATGLLSGPWERRPQVQVVLLDDDGGGIFQLLEPGGRAVRGAGDAAVFERVFATPSGADLPALCAAIGATYTAVGEQDGLDGLRESLAKPADGVSVVHVRVDRSGRRVQAQAIADAVRSAVDAALHADRALLADSRDPTEPRPRARRL